MRDELDLVLEAYFSEDSREIPPTITEQSISLEIVTRRNRRMLILLLILVSLWVVFGSLLFLKWILPFLLQKFASISLALLGAGALGFILTVVGTSFLGGALLKQTAQ